MLIRKLRVQAITVRLNRNIRGHIMKYMGSKNRYAKQLLPIILKDRVEGQWYVEPFVGGANMIDKVEGLRLGSDINPYLIEALKHIRDSIDCLPQNNLEFTEESYKLLRSSDNYKYKGYAGFAFSYSGKWLGGWRRDKEGKRDYVAESYRNAVKQSPQLRGVELLCSSYDKLEIPANSIIYCDPPYKGTTGYKVNFDHDIFWEWCRQKSKHHKVFISEYAAPKDFVSIWEKEVNSSLTKDTGSKQNIEKLFVHESQS